MDCKFNFQIVPDTKKVHILSSIKICPEIPQCPGMSSEPPSKKMKLHQSASTQTSITVNTPRKTKLRREVKILSQRLKRRTKTINSLKSLLNVIKKSVIITTK